MLNFEELMQYAEDAARAHGNLELHESFYGAYSDGWDGSFNISLFNTKQEALDSLERTEEQLEKGSHYDDGALIKLDAVFILEGGEISLKEPLHISIDT